MDDVTIIICTRDRADSLRETLASIGRCAVPPDVAVELLVVDNGSTDHTAAVVREAGLTNLPVRCVLEKTPGLSHARNAGLRASAGELILFTDDDVRVPGNWIEGMCRPILSDRADAVAGGVHFPETHVRALAREPFYSKRGWFACTMAGTPHTLVGANMAFRRRVAAAVGGFDTNLGAGALGFYEETLFSMKLVEAGFRFVPVPEVSVEHHFDLSRLTGATLLSIATRMGKSEAYLSYHWQGDTRPVGKATVRRAWLLLLAQRLLPPWKTTVGELQRAQTLAYWEQMASFAGTPRAYQRPHAAGEGRALPPELSPVSADPP